MYHQNTLKIFSPQYFDMFAVLVPGQITITNSLHFLTHIQGINDATVVIG
jgi:hypothetical protein